MRLIFIDTETTGLSPRHDHRIVEVACVEMKDGCLTGREFHSFINPQRLVPPEAIDIHGIDDAMLAGQPTFDEAAVALVEFVGNGRTVMHNAPFDTEFLAAELLRLGMNVPVLTSAEAVIDTLPRFRRLHPGHPCSLTALCDRYELRLQNDEAWHGALTDARMLARLWVRAGMTV